MIKNVIFDLGNVLLDFSPDKYLNMLDFSNKKKQSLMQNIFKSEEWVELDRGTMTKEQAGRKMIERVPEDKEEINFILNDWVNMLTVIKLSREILLKLVRNKYKIYVLSNFHKDAFNFVKEKYRFFNEFAGIVISADINYIKPEKEIYAYLLNKYHIQPEESLFIDDQLANLKAADRLGIETYHFTDPVLFEKHILKNLLDND